MEQKTYAMSDVEIQQSKRITELEAHIAVLREALDEIGDTACGEARHQYTALTALSSTPEANLREIQARTIEWLFREGWKPDVDLADLANQIRRGEVKL